MVLLKSLLKQRCMVMMNIKIRNNTYYFSWPWALLKIITIWDKFHSMCVRQILEYRTLSSCARKYRTSAKLILDPLSGHKRSLFCALISNSISDIEFVRYFRAHELIARYSSIYFTYFFLSLILHSYSPRDTRTVYTVHIHKRFYINIVFKIILNTKQFGGN